MTDGNGNPLQYSCLGNPMDRGSWHHFNACSQRVTAVLSVDGAGGGTMNCSTPGLLVHHQLPEFTQTHVHRVSDTIQPPHLLLSPLLLPPIPPSIRIFSNESTLRLRWPKYWSFSFTAWCQFSFWRPLRSPAACFTGKGGFGLKSD